ncbi:MAG TPA: four-carbon acid sugar kinase family protein [Burkholderiales bacterium]
MTGRLLLAFYGDDFTGSTDALEALSVAGLKAALFLAPPDQALLAERFPDIQCIGVAGTSRAMSPAEMDAQLAPVLRELWQLGAPLLHYKVCSTFDSAPQVGNIGHVVDMARRELSGDRYVSVLAGVPQLRRYTVFGNHFAAASDEVHRLDRHPTMSRHPTTPMHEADLRVHLGRQSQAPVSLMSVTDLDGDAPTVDARLAQRLSAAPGMLLYDVLDETRLQTAGRLIWQEAQRRPHFVVGSSGVEYALTAHWRASRTIARQMTAFPRPAPVAQVLVISGSASPMTAQQIAWAGHNGFATLRAPAADLVDPARTNVAIAELLDGARKVLASGRSLVVYSASGPDDPSIGVTRERVPVGQNTARLLGKAMGLLTRDLLERTSVRRLVIAGGDTSSYAMQEIGLDALEMKAEIVPGAPLCRGYSRDARIDGLEVALKGGQMGKADYFGQARGT